MKRYTRTTKDGHVPAAHVGDVALLHEAVAEDALAAPGAALKKNRRRKKRGRPPVRGVVGETVSLSLASERASWLSREPARRREGGYAD